MTLLPRGVKVHLAFGFIDMRKGIDGLAMLVRGSCARIPSRAISLYSGAGRPTSSRSCTGMAAAFAFSPSGSSTACSCGRRTWNLAGR
jgi:hypothetical protein